MVLFVVGLAAGVGFAALLALPLWVRCSGLRARVVDLEKLAAAYEADRAEADARCVGLEVERERLYTALDRVSGEASADRVEAHRAAVVLLGMHPELEDLAVFGKRILPVLPQRKALPAGTAVDGEANGRARVRDGSGRFVKAESS